MQIEVAKFIAECTSNGITSPDEMRKAALEKIKNIDDILFKADKLRQTRSKMLFILNALGFDTQKSKKKCSPILEETETESLDNISYNHAVNICNYLMSNNSVTPREIMTKFGISVENDTEIYTVIKWLCASGICVRDKLGTLSIGPNWEKRPVGDKNDTANN